MTEKRPKQPAVEASTKAKSLSRWEGEGGAPVDGRKPKRPRDLNQGEKHMVDLATDDDAPEQAAKQEKKPRPN